MSLDFQDLHAKLMNRFDDFVPLWLPGGKLLNNEFECGDLTGVAGQSLKVNILNGMWCDFATGEAGGDLISLYAAIQDCTMGDAYKILSKQFEPVKPALKPAPKKITAPVKTKPIKHKIPPKGTPLGKFNHPKYGRPSVGYCYRTLSGQRHFFICRYNTDDGKTFLPWTWDGGKWQAKSLPAPRPLFNLDLLATHPIGKPIVIVEGEKAAQAAQKTHESLLRGNVLARWY